MTTLHLTLKMTTAQEDETSVTNNNLSKDYPHPDDHAKQKQKNKNSMNNVGLEARRVRTVWKEYTDVGRRRGSARGIGGRKWKGTREQRSCRIENGSTCSRKSVKWRMDEQRK